MMQAGAPGLSDLISHRFRGFSEHENSLAGLHAALDFGVLTLEFDVRVAACGTPMVYHDEYAIDALGQKRFVCDVKAENFAQAGGAFTHMPSLEDILVECARRKNPALKLLIDIKDQGFEEQIYALVRLYRMHAQSLIVSWLPEVLYRMHDIDPGLPLCLSHWCGDIHDWIAQIHQVNVSKDGHIPRNDIPYVTGLRSGWVAKSGLTGKVLAILKSSNGAVCVPQDMLTAQLSDYYHGHDLIVTTFSYTDWAAIQAHKSALNIDMYFIDNKEVFESLA